MAFKTVYYEVRANGLNTAETVAKLLMSPTYNDKNILLKLIRVMEEGEDK